MPPQTGGQPGAEGYYEADARSPKTILFRFRPELVAMPSGTSALRILKNVWHKYHKGTDVLDARYTGFVPVVMDGGDILLPFRVVRQRIEGCCIETEYEFGRRSFRGWPVVLDQLLLYWSALGLSRPQRHSTSRGFIAEPNIHIIRRQHLTEAADLLIEDTLLGCLRRKVLWFSTRYFPGAAVEVSGLRRSGDAIGWGSDGEMWFDIYAQRCAADEISYSCRLAEANPTANRLGLNDPREGATILSLSHPSAADHDRVTPYQRGVAWAEPEDAVTRLLGLLNQQPAYRTFRLTARAYCRSVAG